MSEKEVFQAHQAEYIDVKQFVFKYSRYWYSFVACILLCLAFALLYLYWATPQYKITSTMLLKNGEIEANTLSNSAQLGEIDLFNTKQIIDNEIEVLKSKSLMQRVFSELSLFVTYYEKQGFKTVEIYGQKVPIRISINKLHSSAYDNPITITRKTSTTFDLAEENGDVSTHKYGEEISKPYGIFSVISAPVGPAADSRIQGPIIVRFQNITKLASDYNDALKVEAVNKRTSVIRISLIEPVPEKGTDIINKLLEVYGKEALEDRNLIAHTTIQFIDQRLKYLTSELSEVEKDVEQYKRQNELTDVTSNADQYLEQAGETRKQIADLDIQIDVLGSIEDYINKQPGKYELVPSTLTIQDPTLMQLITKFNDLQLERERMLRTTLPNNPLVQEQNDQLASLQLSILENLHNIKNSLTITRKSLETSSNRFRSQIQKVPSIERDLLEINRQQGTKGNLYLYLLQKREESALALEVTVSKSRMLDPATPDPYPVSPKKTLVYLFALIIGIGTPFTAIYLKDALNDKVQSKKDVQRATNTPILGEISVNSTNKNLVVKEESGSSIAEHFRLVRSNLQFATAGKENKVILVTSSISGEGKTFFCINLASSLTLIGKKVVLLELDLRRPSLMKQLDLVREKGISDFLVASDKVFIEDIIKPYGPVPGLYIANCGSIPPNPAELMMSENLAHLISELRASFDYVIVDTAPVGMVADAFSLSSITDSTIYLVRYNYTAKPNLELIEDIYVNKKFNHPMIVLNSAKEGVKHAYGYGYTYGYAKNKKEEISVS